jgi:PKD repeat protein
MTMKKIYNLIAGATLFASLSANAAGGPDSYGYTWMTSLDAGGPTYNWIDITSYPGVQTVTGLADDNSAAGMINIGFNFHYYWSDYSQLKVGSNGWLSFNNISNMASCFFAIPTPGGPGDNYLAPLTGDLNFTGAGNPGVVRYWTNNVDTFIISYIDVPFWSVNAPGWAGANSFQVILSNVDSSITYQYGSLGGFAPNAACIDLTVGIENSTGAIGLQVHSDALPPTNYAIKFFYPPVVLISVQDALPVWNGAVGSGAKFIVNNLAFPLTTDFRNGGNTAMNNLVLSTSITDAASATVHSSSGNLPMLAAGDDSVFTFPAAWTPTATGQYTWQSAVTTSSDINPVNDVLNTELDVVNPCVPTMPLTYLTTGTPNGSLNWNGGANDDGAAVYFEPPVYPYTVSTLQYYISSNVSDAFIAQIYDDNGPNGGPGTLLFSTTVASASVISSAWNTVTVTVPVTLSSGGFYVAWLQGGTTIFLGTESAGPRSHHNYEILDNAWAGYREDNIEDLCIRAVISGYAGTPTAALATTANQLNLTTSNNTTGLATSYLWDFGDMTTSTQMAPTHTYAAAGTYTVCLTATSPCGSNQACTTITVCETPAAAFMQTTNSLNANFMDMSTGTATTWMWDFGDASTSSSQNPSHTYAMGGTYNVCLIVGNNCGELDTICQMVSVCAPNTAGFTNTALGLNTTFTDMSAGAVDTWAWDFGDSNTSSSQSPSHTYAAPGVYNVCLIVSNNCGNADTICQMVTVCDLGVAAFTYTTNEDSIMVSDASSGGIMEWFWDFGDGNTDTVQNPGTHHYATGGVYTICLITTDSCGVMDTVCVQDTIFITGYNVNMAGVNSVYPNPASSEVTVELWWNVTSDIEIFDATGNLVYRQNEVAGNIIRVDVNDLTTGLYTMRITNKGGTTVRRFVKE